MVVWSNICYPNNTFTCTYKRKMSSLKEMFIKIIQRLYSELLNERNCLKI